MISCSKLESMVARGKCLLFSGLFGLLLSGLMYDPYGLLQQPHVKHFLFVTFPPLKSLLYGHILPFLDRPFVPTSANENMFSNGTVSFPPRYLDDRHRLQGRWVHEDKGWLVPLQFAAAPNHGGPTSLGVYAVNKIPKNTLIRKSAVVDPHGLSRGAGIGRAPGIFIQLRSYEDLEQFCQLHNPQASTADRAALMRYVSDYLFRAKPAFGVAENDTLYREKTPADEQVFGVWVPGCADNDHNADQLPSVEDRLVVEDGITYMGMYVMRDVEAGELLVSDYNGAYGPPPEWAARFADTFTAGWLAFEGYNHKAVRNQAGKKQITGTAATN
jgi:hypothetical protein